MNFINKDNLVKLIQEMPREEFEVNGDVGSGELGMALFTYGGDTECSTMGEGQSVSESMVDLGNAMAMGELDIVGAKILKCANHLRTCDDPKTLRAARKLIHKSCGYGCPYRDYVYFALKHCALYHGSQGLYIGELKRDGSTIQYIGNLDALDKIGATIIHG